MRGGLAQRLVMLVHNENCRGAWLWAWLTLRKAPVGPGRLVVPCSRAIFQAAPPGLALDQVTGTAPRASIAAFSPSCASETTSLTPVVRAGSGSPAGGRPPAPIGSR